ncbi:MAG TPA: hypothetical protein VMW92_06085 [Candidatus Heimdallarchaeota archaeon]|nr:hypothetical protein [Candidatus Heimdallarchaeota archaeon]
MSEKISKKKQSAKTQEIVKVKNVLPELPHSKLSIPGCKRGKTFLNIDQSVSEEDYFKIGQALLTIKGTLQWWIGDWINAGKEKYSRNKYDIALYEFHYTYGTLANIASICEKVKSSCRHENLSFEHHRAVAPLPPEEQVFWLDNAEKPPDRVYGKWSVRELWKRIIDTRLLAEKSDYLKETKDKYFIYISTKDNVYNYSGYIEVLNRSVKSLTNKIKRLLEYKPYSGFSEKIKPQFCKTDEEREFSKNCSRLFWNLEWLLDEQLSKLTLLKIHLSDEPLLLSDVADYCNGICNPDLLRFVDFWEHARSESTLFRFHACFAICSRVAEILNTEVRHLIRYSKEYFADCYDSDYERQKEFIKEIVDKFRYKCSALRSHLDDLEKIFTEHVPEPIDEENVEGMKKHMFDSCAEKEKSKAPESKGQSENKDMEKELYELMKDI